MTATTPTRYALADATDEPEHYYPSVEPIGRAYAPIRSGPHMGSQLVYSVYAARGQGVARRVLVRALGTRVATDTGSRLVPVDGDRPLVWLSAARFTVRLHIVTRP